MSASLSVNETVSLVKLAWRAAGYPWSIASEAGYAVGWLEQRELPGAQLASALVNDLDAISFDRLKPAEGSITAGNCWRSTGSALCPVMSGLTLADYSGAFEPEQRVQLADVYGPCLLLPFLNRLQRINGSVITLEWDRVCAYVLDGECYVRLKSRESLWLCLSEPAPVNVSVSFTRQITADELSGYGRCIVSAVPRCHVDQSDLLNLRQYAHRTYAPATDSSRISGAGAGMTDND
ncbi:MAG: DUF3726 domain-containing protein [Granulosicoccus sp.]